MRRKRRRSGQEPLQEVDQDASDGEEQQFFDAAERALQPQPDEFNPCGIDKTLTVARRRYGGLLVATLPCGRV